MQVVAILGRVVEARVAAWVAVMAPAEDSVAVVEIAWEAGMSRATAAAAGVRSEATMATTDRARTHRAIGAHRVLAHEAAVARAVVDSAAGAAAAADAVAADEGADER